MKREGLRLRLARWLEPAAGQPAGGAERAVHTMARPAGAPEPAPATAGPGGAPEPYGYTDPTDFQHWFMDADKAEAYLASLAEPTT